MSDLITTKILSPEETPEGKHWYAVIESRWVVATDRIHAERIVDTCVMCASIGRRDALQKVRTAIGL